VQDANQKQLRHSFWLADFRLSSKSMQITNTQSSIQDALDLFIRDKRYQICTSSFNFWRNWRSSAKNFPQRFWVFINFHWTSEGHIWNNS